MDAKRELAAADRGLFRYITERMSDEIRLVPPALIPGGAAAPRAATADLADGILVSKVAGVLASSAASKFRPSASDSRSRYMYRPIWRALSEPLGERTRFVELPAEGSPIVHELSEGESAADGWIQVEATDLPPQESATSPRRAYDIHQKIRDWAEKHSVPIDRLVSPSPPRPSDSGVPQPPAQSPDAFTRGLMSLTPSELARIQVPADLVLEMFRRVPRL